MTPEQIERIRASWEMAAPIADEAARLFYGKLFEIDPSAHALFAGVDMAEQRRRLVAALGLVIGRLDAFAEHKPTLEALGRRHADYGVTAAHYDSVGEALLWTLKTGLGDAFTHDMRAAWTIAYALIASAMRDAAEAGQSAAA